MEPCGASETLNFMTVRGGARLLGAAKHVTTCRLRRSFRAPRSWLETPGLCAMTGQRTHLASGSGPAVATGLFSANLAEARHSLRVEGHHVKAEVTSA